MIYPRSEPIGSATSHNERLTSTYPGDTRSMCALLAFLSQHGGSGWVFDIIDAAERMDVNGARELQAAIKEAADRAGI